MLRLLPRQQQLQLQRLLLLPPLAEAWWRPGGLLPVLSHRGTLQQGCRLLAAYLQRQQRRRAQVLPGACLLRLLPLPLHLVVAS
jgi:hypothetical protein